MHERLLSHVVSTRTAIMAVTLPAPLVYIAPYCAMQRVRSLFELPLKSQLFHPTMASASFFTPMTASLLIQRRLC